MVNCISEKNNLPAFFQILLCFHFCVSVHQQNSTWTGPLRLTADISTWQLGKYDILFVVAFIIFLCCLLHLWAYTSLRSIIGILQICSIKTPNSSAWNRLKHVFMLLRSPLMTHRFSHFYSFQSSTYFIFKGYELDRQSNQRPWGWLDASSAALILRLTKLKHKGLPRSGTLQIFSR